MITLQQFLEICKANPKLDIYDLIYPQSELREEIFRKAVELGVVLEDEMEPTRASLVALGEHYKIQSLIDY